MRKLNKLGFAPLLIVLAVVVIGGIGFAGWTVYNNQKAKDNAQVNSESNSEVAGQSSPTIESVKDIDQAQKSLDSSNVEADLDSSEIDKDLNSIL